jgi:hypothetical protein
MKRRTDAQRILSLELRFRVHIVTLSSLLAICNDGVGGRGKNVRANNNKRIQESCAQPVYCCLSDVEVVCGFRGDGREC